MSALSFFPADADRAPQEALVEGSRSISHGELRELTNAVAQEMRTAGIGPGDRVACIGRPSIEYAAALLALWHIRAVACPLDRRLPPAVAAARIRDVACRFAVVGEPRAPFAAAVGVCCLTLSDLLSRQSAREVFRVPARLDSRRPATIIHTSGSSAASRAALHTLRNHWLSALGSNEHLPVCPGSRWLLALPFHHVSGLAILFRTLPFGACAVLPEPEETFTAAILRHRPSHVSAVAAQLDELVTSAEEGADVAFLKVVLAGGSAIPRGLVARAVTAGLPLYLSYGSTEMSSQIATSAREAGDTAIAVRYRVLAHREVSVSEKGEILVKGGTLFRGFVRGQRVDPALTSDGWYRTGDRGCLDSPGVLNVTGRLDRMFISGGENIQPEEIEEALARLPGIAAGAVVASPHPRFGFRPVAFIRTSDPPRPGLRDVVVAYLASQLPSYKIPDEYYLLQDDDFGGLKIDYQRLGSRARLGRSLERLP